MEYGTALNNTGAIGLQRWHDPQAGGRVPFREVNVRDLAGFPEGSSVGPDEFEMAGVLRGKTGPVKVLGQGDLTVKLTVRANKFSAGARQKIEGAGGSIETIE